MRVRTTVLAVLACSSLTFVAACGGSNPGNANPAPTSASSSSGLPSHGAPAVTAPLTNTANAESAPCSLVQEAQLGTLGLKVKQARTDDLGLGKNCTWVFEEGGNIGGGLVVQNKEGLSSLYHQKEQNLLTTFEPQQPIEGYPAVVYGNGGEGEGACTLAVGVRDDLAYTVVSQLRAGNPFLSKPCDLATKIASFAIKQLKGA